MKKEKNIEEGKPTLEEVDSYPVPDYLAPQLVKNFDYTLDEATKLVREAKRMLYLCILSGQSIAPSTRVDNAWHSMLVFTRFYSDFGEFIGGFVHHDPTPPEFWKEKEESGEISLEEGTPTYKKTKENYATFFGEAPDPWVWP